MGGDKPRPCGNPLIMQLPVGLIDTSGETSQNGSKMAGSLP